MACVRPLRVFSLWSLLLCLTWINDAKQVETFLSCALSCTASLECGWIVFYKKSHKCFPRNSLDCGYMNNNASKVYRRLHSEESLDGNSQRSFSFQLMDPNRITCSDSMIPCNKPAPIKYAHVQYDTVFPGSKAKYICYDGFSFEGTTVKVVTCMPNGAWSALYVVCSENK